MTGSEMKIGIYFVMVVLMFASFGVVKGKEKPQMNNEVSLPSEIAGWKWDGKEMMYDSKSVFQYMDGAAELYLAYGFRNLRVRRFEKPNQPPITLELYDMASPENAYGVFSFERQDEPVGIGQGSEFGGGLLRFWKGNYFVSIYADGEGPDVQPAVLKIGEAVSLQIRVTGSEPKLIGFFPGKDYGLVDKSVRYIKSHVLLNQRFFLSHQNILDLNPKTEAGLAQYLQDKQKVTFLLIRYPASAEAQTAYTKFIKSYMPEAAGKDRLKTEDQKWTLARQRNEFILIIFGSPTESDAETLLKAAENKLPTEH